MLQGHEGNEKDAQTELIQCSSCVTFCSLRSCVASMHVHNLTLTAMQCSPKPCINILNQALRCTLVCRSVASVFLSDASSVCFSFCAAFILSSVCPPFYIFHIPVGITLHTLHSASIHPAMHLSIYLIVYLFIHLSDQSVSSF